MALAEKEQKEQQKRLERQRNAFRSDMMKVVGMDLIITDPCYLFSNIWDVVDINSPLYPKKYDFQGTSALVANTIYGDWMCSLDGDKGHEKHRFGTFTADAGCVCAAMVKNHKRVEKLKKLPEICYTVIPKFTGRVLIIHNKGYCHVEGIGRSKGEHVEFISRQIG